MKPLDDTTSVFTAAHVFDLICEALDGLDLDASIRDEVECEMRHAVEACASWDTEPPAAPDAFAARVAWKNRQLEASRRKNLLA